VERHYGLDRSASKRNAYGARRLAVLGGNRSLGIFDWVRELGCMA
jgi:hypothetical protein